MKKTFYELFKDFAEFWQALKPRLVKDFRTKDHINYLFFSNRIYDYYKHDTFWGSSDEALSKIFTQIAFDCAEFSKREGIYAQIYEKTDQLLKYNTRTEQKRQVETITNPPKTTTTYNEPIYSAQDMVEGSHGFHNRTDWLKTTQKQVGTVNSTVKEGIKVMDKDGKVKIIPNYVEVYTQDNAGLARLLAVSNSIEIDLTKYLNRYRKFFYSSYGLDGELIKVAGSKRYVFKSYEEMEEDLESENKKKGRIDTQEAEISYREWSKKFKEENPDQTPNFQLYTIYRLEKRKVELEKELKKTSGVFRDKINLRLSFTESLIEGFKKEIKMLPVGNPEEKLPLGADDETREKSSYWARINQVVGYTEFKEIFADFVDGYNDLVEEGLQDKIPSQMFLLLGPPGVGKSYISEMIAEATDLPIETLSMNGKKETSVFFGVPQEWAGAGVGEILKAMIKHKSRLVIFLLDENAPKKFKKS
jgi:hypothetical protein